MSHSPKSSERETVPLVLSLLVTLGLLGGLGMLIASRGRAWLGWDSRQGIVEMPDSLARQPGQRVSRGEFQLISAQEMDRAPQSFHSLKAAGVSAMAQQLEAVAAEHFEAALQLYPNDPETRIYANNARIGPGPAVDVAVTVPISGSSLGNALEMLRGFAQAQQEINAGGGIGGARLRIYIADDGDRPEAARDLAKQFVQQPSIKTVLGHWTSDVSLAAAEVYNAAQMPFMTPISTANELSSIGPYSFRAALTNAAGGQALATHALEQWQAEKVAIFYVKGVTYSEEIRQQFSAALTAGGGEVVAKFDLGASQFLPRQAVEEAIAAGAQVLLLATNNASVDRSLQVIQANQGRLKLLGDLANLYSPRTLDLGSDAEGLVMALSWSIDQPEAAAFVDRSRSLWRADVNYASANCYDALQAIATALAGNKDRKGVAQALRSDGFASQGASTKVEFQPSGDRRLVPQLVEVRDRGSRANSRSGTGYDFMAIAR